MDNSLKELLKKFNQLDLSKKNEKVEKNVFEIAGYPHYENVISNILSFFFDTEEEHGFKDLWIKSLINCYLAKNNIKDISSDVISTKTIEREYSNGSDKRIDLLIDCSSFLILIENKIYASLYNDLDIYAEMANNYLKNTDNEGVPILKIVLSLFMVDNIPQDDVINITYDELFTELEKNMDEYQTSNKWGILSEDFIESIKRRKSNMKLDNKWIEFAVENTDDISSLIDVYNKDCQMRFDFCKELWKKIKELDNNLHVGTYSGGKNDPYYSVYLNIKLSDTTTVCIETYIMKKPSKKAYEDYDKVYVALWSRDRRTYDYLQRLVNITGVNNAEKHTSDGWKEQYLLQILPVNSINTDTLANDIVRYAHSIEKE